MKNTETPVTVNPNLGAICAPLLDCLPLAIRDGHSITIHNLPADLSRETLEQSPILNICHQMKHLYADGDRVGRKGIIQKIAGKKSLENNTIRMCISYTYSLRKESDKTIVTINFMPSYTKSHPPRFIQNTDASERPMSDKEVADQMDVFVGTCREEISDFFRGMMHIALEQATASAIAAFA